jgi:uncharacterized membrane protein
MSKVGAIWTLFRKGNMVADPQKWKKRQIEATVLGGVIVAAIQVLQAFGVEIPISADDATAIATGVLVVINAVLTVTTTEKIGLPNPELQHQSNASNTELSKESNEVQGGFGQKTNVVTRQDFSD